MAKKGFIGLVTIFIIAITLLLVVPGAGAQTQTLYINEILVGNASTNMDTTHKNYSSWLEIYNASNSSINLKDYSLAYLDNGATSAISWKVPGTINVPAKGRAIIWLDERNYSNHASFELDMRGQWIRLLSPTNVILDTVIYDMRDSDNVLLPDISYGRQGDGGNNWVYFDQPTPGTPNTTPGFATPNLAAAPTFSPQGGFYTGNQTVSLSTSETGGVIRYTTDGSIPTSTSPVYGSPITVTKPTVIRARVFAPSKQISQTASHTYLINVSRKLPVVSLATKPAHLFDDEIGIYVIGTKGSLGCQNTVANWFRKWERPASIEMFEPDGTRVVAQDVGFEIHGGCSRMNPNKSLEIKARRTYGDNDIDYQVLPDKPITSYKRLILRTSGQDATGTLFRDALQHYLAKDVMDIDYQGYRPAILFLNGQYWGIYNIRDKADEAFVEQNYDLDADSDFDMIERNGIVNAGSITAWNALYSYVEQNNLSNPTHYQYIKGQVDLEEYMNYFILQIYVANYDWPANNIRFWRAYDNGRWRWLIYDLDAGFSNATNNTLSNVMNGQGHAGKPVAIYSTLMFRKLMQNPEFRNDFAQRFASHINLTFAPARVNAMIDQFQAGIAPEMPAHISRWGQPNSLSAWNTNINKLRTFGNNRPTHMRNHLNSYLGSPGTANLTVNITGDGVVLAAGVQVPGSGYSGPYFKGIPMTLEAVPQPGKQFSHWAETNETDPKITVTLNGNMTRTAVFGSAPPPPPIVITEIHYNPAGAQGNDEDYEFIELYNAGGSAANLSGFTMVGADFTFPSGTSIASGEYIVLAANSGTYTGNGYKVFQWSSGELSNNNEEIALLDTSGQKADSVHYDDESPWPTAPDGGGPSLSLLDPALDNAVAENWAPSGVAGGSPGAANSFSPPPSPPPPIVINEIHYNPTGTDDPYEFVELVNTGAEVVTLDGFQFAGITYVFPTGSSIAAGEYILVAKLAATYTGNDYQVFQWSSGSLSNDGEAVTLMDADGNVVDTVTFGLAAPWPASPNNFGPSLSLISPALDNSLGSNWGASQAAGGSPGVVNTIAPTPPPPPPIVINEIHYNPAASQGDQALFEFIELFNAGSSTVNLADYSTYGFDFVFPDGATIDPGEYIVLAQTAATYAGNDYQAFQWTNGGLNNTSELLILYDTAGNAVDYVTYSNSAPWPTTPGGNGPSLSLTSPTLDNALAASWVASADVGGTPGEANAAPPPTTATLTVVKQVVGTAPGAAWQFNGPQGAFTLPAAGGQQVFNDLAPGGYTVSETAVSGYTAAVSCTNSASGTNSVSVTLAAGDAVTCTFVNTKQDDPPAPASLTVIKQVVGAAPGSAWQFNGPQGAFTLAAAGGQQLFTNLTPGGYTVSETAVSGYTAAVSCSNGASGTNSVSVTLVAGDAVTCTFVNTKQDDPPANECDDVPGNLLANPGFTGGKTNWTFYTNGTGSFITSNAAPSNCTPHARVTTLSQGSNVQLYQTKFNLKPNTDYRLRLLARSSAGQDVTVFIERHTAPNTKYGLNSRLLNLTPEWQWFDIEFKTSGFSAPTTDTRLRLWLAPYDINGGYYEFDQFSLVEATGEPSPPPTTATLTVVQKVVGGAPGNTWQYDGTLGAFTLAAGGGQRVFTNLTPGTYTVSETAVNGYSTAVSCSSGVSGTNSVTLNLAAGNSVTCTFTNTNQSDPPPTGGCDPVAGNILANPGFELNTQSWTFYTNGKGTFTTTSQNAHECNKAAQINIQQGGNNVQLYQIGVNLQAGKTYTLTFAAKASTNRPIMVALIKHTTPNTNYGLNKTFNLTTEWQVFNVQFSTKGFSGNVSDGRLRFVLQSADAPGDIFYFDGISLVP